MSDCGHRPDCLCPCVDPPFMLCNSCLSAHVFEPNHPSVIRTPYDPSSVGSNQQNPLLNEVEAEVCTTFQAIENSLKALRIQVLREMKIVVQTALQEVTQNLPLSEMAQAILSNTWRQALGLDRLAKKVLEDARTQFEKFLPPNASTPPSLFDLHYLQHDRVQTWDYGLQIMREPVQLIGLRENELLDTSCYINSAINEIIVFTQCEAPCYRVRTDTGVVTAIGGMRVSRRNFGAHVSPLSDSNSSEFICVLGGQGDDLSPLKSSEYLRQNKWVKFEENLDLLVPRSHFQPVEHDKKLYLIGGSDESCEIVEIRYWRTLGKVSPPYRMPGLGLSSMTLSISINNELVLIWGETIRTQAFSLKGGSTLPLETLISYSPTRPGLNQQEVWVLLSDGNVVRVK